MSDTQEETVRVRIAAGYHYQDGESHPPKTELTVRKAVYEAFPNKFDPIAASDAAQNDTTATHSDDGSTFDAAVFVDRVPQDDVIADIESGEYDAHLDAIEAAETEGKERNGVLDTIDARREEA